MSKKIKSYLVKKKNNKKLSHPQPWKSKEKRKRKRKKGNNEERKKERGNVLRKAQKRKKEELDKLHMCKCTWTFLSIKQSYFLTSIFSPFWRENFLVGLGRKHLGPIIYFPSFPPN